ncbi:MAG: type II toxin-antitoxin system HicB family antitoxin [Deltaproteobacteria bacterium]|nr:type II toxin-antitoxin system HicB family antitoxin [Deltaproteobacteria bacterium]
MKPFIRFDMKVPARIFKEGDGFVSHCPIFDVSSQGDTEEEARKNLVEALTGFIMVCHEMGTIFEVLKEAGFVPGTAEEPEARTDDEINLIDIPLPFMLSDNGHSQCRA